MKHVLKNQHGQALIELIIFLPLMFTLYSVISGFAGAINGSINQQKATRAYHYYLAQNNSTIPTPKASNPDFKKLGQNVVGWSNKIVNKQPVMPCYRISLPFKKADSDVCDDPYSDAKSQYIRVGTVYGVCGGTYQKEGSNMVLIPDGNNSNFKSAYDVASCLIQ